ncbi:hypothetical protein [Dyadobacter sediminis]|nr:hypothetical protein [Dyadobacter sediminis]
MDSFSIKSGCIFDDQKQIFCTNQVRMPVFGTSGMCKPGFPLLAGSCN